MAAAANKTIVLLSDGTGNSSAMLFRTNVWRIYEALDVSAMVSMTRGLAPMVKAKLAPKAWAERSRLPRLTALEMPSTPMAK